MIILGTNSIKDTGYNVANSCRFNDGDTAYMNRTLGTPTNRRIWTLSLWTKRSKLSDEGFIFGADASSGNSTRDGLRFESSDPTPLWSG